MLTTLKLTLLISFATTINGLLYFLKRIPLVKSLFSNVGYEHAKLTKGVVVVSIIIKVIKELLKRIMLLFLGLGIPLIYLYEKTSVDVLISTFWHLFISFYFLLPVLNTNILQPGRRKFICVKLMRMDAKKFVFADFFSVWIMRIILEIPLFYIMSSLLGVNVWLVYLLVIAKNMFSLFVEAFHLTYFERTGELFHKQLGINIGLLLGVTVLGYYPIFWKRPIIFQEVGLVAIGFTGIILGCVGLHYILHYRNYLQAIQEANKLSELAVDKKNMSNQAQFNSVKLKNKDISIEEIKGSIYANKEGFGFLNAIFFARHKRILLQPIILQVIVIGGLLAVAYIVSFFIADFHSTYILLIKKSAAMFVFALYCMSTSQKATKAMFYNCDISLLHYGFYTNSQAVLTTFTVRVKYLIGTNLLPALLLGVGLLILDFLTGGSGVTLLPVAILIAILSIFFSVHNLFLYYIFQPYTTDLSIKSPLFSIFNVVTYLLSYLCLQLDGLPMGFLIGVAIGTALYSVIALLIVYRFAPKTFVIK